MKPHIQALETGALLLQYHLSQTIFTSKVYPLKSSNGSSIIICGHENGLYILWRGGRPLKQHVEKKAESKDSNGGVDVMIIDSDDDEPATAYVDKPEFEAEEEEYDSSRPFLPFVQDLDLPLGTAVLDIAFPRMPPNVQRAAIVMPAMVNDKMVIGAACADGTIQIIQLPLTPPSYQSKRRPALQADISLLIAGKGNWGERVLILPNPIAQQAIVKGISMAFAAQAVSQSIEDSEEGDADETVDANIEGPKWDLIVASHTSERVGKLFVHKIPVSDDETWFAKAPPHELLWHSETLPSSATSVRLFVDSSATSWHAPRVLVSLLHGPINIFECGTEEDMDQGKWTIALYPGFPKTRSSMLQQRKVLDAQWVLGGEGIIVILADGEWGVWNLSTSKSSRLMASIPTKFSLRGSIHTAYYGSGPSAPTSMRNAKPRLFPMTPGTRKLKQDALFSEMSPQTQESHLGGISVLDSSNASSKTGIESLLIWHGEKICQISNLAAHFSVGKEAGKTQNPFNSIQEVAAIDLGGDLRNSVVMLTPPEPSTTNFSRPIPDLLVSTMRSLVILTQPLMSPHTRAIHAGKTVSTLELDQKLLKAGLHGLDDIDRMLGTLGNQSNGRNTS